MFQNQLSNPKRSSGVSWSSSRLQIVFFSFFLFKSSRFFVKRQKWNSNCLKLESRFHLFWRIWTSFVKNKFLQKIMSTFTAKGRFGFVHLHRLKKWLQPHSEAMHEKSQINHRRDIDWAIWCIEFTNNKSLTSNLFRFLFIIIWSSDWTTRLISLLVFHYEAFVTGRKL